MAEKIRVLYVDDESTLLKLCKIFLERSGDLTLKTATSAPDAIRLLEKEKFDVIVSDYQMPAMDGITAGKSGRNQRGWLGRVPHSGSRCRACRHKRNTEDPGLCLSST